MLRRLSKLFTGARAARQIQRAGGPTRVRLLKIEQPRGVLLTSSPLLVDVDTAAGETVRIDAEIPIPPPYAWAYRVARRLRLPLASTLDPEKIRFEIPVPDWAWPGKRKPRATTGTVPFDPTGSRA